MKPEAPLPFMPSLPPYEGEPDAWREWIGTLAIPATCGLELAEVAEGRLVMTLESSPWIPNPNGSVNGGFVLACVDQVAGIVATTTMAPGELPSTATLSAEFYRPAMAPLTFVGSVARRGRTMIFVSVDVERADGLLCLHASGVMAPSSLDFNSPQGERPPA